MNKKKMITKKSRTDFLCQHSLLVFWEFWKTYGQENNRNNHGQSKTKAPLILQIGFMINRRKHLLLCALRDIFQLSSNMTLYRMGGDLINIITNKTKFDTKMIQAQTFWKKSKKNNWAVICIFLFISHAVHLKTQSHVVVNDWAIITS